jgi:hypothetical protein
MGRPDDMYSHSPQLFRAVWKSEVYGDKKTNASKEV